MMHARRTVGDADAVTDNRDETVSDGPSEEEGVDVIIGDTLMLCDTLPEGLAELDTDSSDDRESETCTEAVSDTHNVTDGELVGDNVATASVGVGRGVPPPKLAAGENDATPEEKADADIKNDADAVTDGEREVDIVAEGDLDVEETSELVGAGVYE